VPSRGTIGHLAAGFEAERLLSVRFIVSVCLDAARAMGVNQKGVRGWVVPNAYPMLKLEA